MRRKLAVVLAAIMLSLGITSVVEVHSTKPASAANYCGSIWDGSCYFTYLICGPWHFEWFGDTLLGFDRCGTHRFA